MAIPHKIVVYATDINKTLLDRRIISPAEEKPFIESIYHWEGKMHFEKPTTSEYFVHNRIPNLDLLVLGLARKIKEQIPNHYVEKKLPAYAVEFSEFEHGASKAIFPISRALNEKEKYNFVHLLTQELGDKSRFVEFRP